MNSILDALIKSERNGKAGVVATIVQVEGSAYQREGARCLVLDSGEIVGMLSGGCVEGELKKQAFDVIQSGTPTLISFDFSSEEDLLFGFGSGCGGKLLIWLEPFFPGTSITLLDELKNREQTASSYLSLTILESDNPFVYPIGKRWREDVNQSSLQPENGKAGLVKGLKDHVQLVLFAERVEPKPHLTIVGTGDDALFLSRLAKQLNWHVRLVFHQTERATKTFFSDVDELVHVPRGNFTLLPISPHHYVVVMSHHFEIDLEAVKQLLPTNISYIGLLGSRTRINRLLKTIKNEGSFYETLISKKLHAPVGLDLGSKTPEEITLSIMAELVAFHHKAKGGFLSERKTRHGTRNETSSG